MPRARLRNLGLTIGRIPTGQFNAITDVPGALAGHTTLVHDEPRIARTGVTVVYLVRVRFGTITPFAAISPLTVTAK